jgi:hypothetical protein
VVFTLLGRASSKDFFQNLVKFIPFVSAIVNNEQLPPGYMECIGICPCLLYSLPSVFVYTFGDYVSCNLQITYANTTVLT